MVQVYHGSHTTTVPRKGSATARAAQALGVVGVLAWTPVALALPAWTRGNYVRYRVRAVRESLVRAGANA